MAFTEPTLVAWSSAEPRSCRLFLVDFLVRMWRLNACERLTEPLPRTRMRFLAPDLVFIFGIAVPFICCPQRCSPALAPARLWRLGPHRPRAYRGDVLASPAPSPAAPASSSEPAASPSAGPPASGT